MLKYVCSPELSFCQGSIWDTFASYNDISDAGEEKRAKPFLRSVPDLVTGGGKGRGYPGKKERR